MKKNRVAALGLTAGLLAGGAAGLSIVPGIASAQTASESPSSSTAPARDQWLKDALAGLVSDGTITQTQADKIQATLEAAKPAHRGGGPGMRGPGRGGRRGPVSLDAAAGALGMTAEELRSALQGGQSLAAVATSKGIAPEKVVSALVADAKSRIAARVVAGGMTQAEADQKLAGLEAHIRDHVNNVRPERPKPAPPAESGSTAETKTA